MQGVPPVEQARAAAPAPHGDGTQERVRASPVARRIARELGVELSGVTGTGPGGRIVKADVEAAAGPKDKAPRLSAVSSEPAQAPAARGGARATAGDVG